MKAITTKYDRATTTEFRGIAHLCHIHLFGTNSAQCTLDELLHDKNDMYTNEQVNPIVFSRDGYITEWYSLLRTRIVINKEIRLNDKEANKEIFQKSE